jgi:ubiquinone/menaquinone biosynthesis C-methylase UbiE
MRSFEADFHIKSSTLILDVGGSFFNWQFIAARPTIVLLNLTAEYLGERRDRGEFLRVIGDGCHLPFKDGAFDVVFCNSVIEHLTRAERQRQLAREIQRVGDQYFIQTPDKRFPIEPHFLAPFFHWLPKRIQRRIVRYVTPWGWITRSTKTQADALVDEMRLLSPREVLAMLPGARIEHERLLGLPKAIIAHGGIDRQLGASFSRRDAE